MPGFWWRILLGPDGGKCLHIGAYNFLAVCCVIPTFHADTAGRDGTRTSPLARVGAQFCGAEKMRIGKEIVPARTLPMLP